MTCKDCIHEKICDHFILQGLPWGDGEFPAELFCDQFKPKSRYIELPCAVGDTVYAYCETFGVILPYFVETLSCAYYDKNKVIWQYEANCTNDEESELLDSIDFEFEDIGKTVFLTKEEAEKALKERH